MAFIPDLHKYDYGQGAYYRPITKAVGWLDHEHDFESALPTEELLGLLWGYCKISVAQTRGVHGCELCPSGFSIRAQRNGESLLLGTSEIRVFGKDSNIYAAPTLVYHYVSVHNYKPPEEFLKALVESPKPPDSSYFERLAKVGLTWSNTLAPLDPAQEKILLARIRQQTRAKLRSNRWR